MGYDESYNGWTNRETWLVNLWYNPESRDDLDYIREDLKQKIADLGVGILADMIDFGAINWRELEEACCGDEGEEGDEDED